MDDELKKTFERNFVFNTAPKCPFCGGYMLPLNYLADTQGYRCSAAWLYDDVPGDLKACSNCGVVKFYPDKSKEIKESVSSPKARKKSNDTFKRLIEELNEEAKNLGYIEE